MRKCIALIAHDNKKSELIEWAKKHRHILAQHDLCGTGTTGSLLEEALGLPVKKFLSGPVGGDQQIGAGVLCVCVWVGVWVCGCVCVCVWVGVGVWV